MSREHKFKYKINEVFVEVTYTVDDDIFDITVNGIDLGYFIPVTQNSIRLVAETDYAGHLVEEAQSKMEEQGGTK